MRVYRFLLAVALACPLVALAQEPGSNVTFTGSVQSDVLLPQEDDKIGGCSQNLYAQFLYLTSTCT